MKVLLADDDRVTTTLLSSVLLRRGWSVMTVHDAMQALMFAGKDPRPDAIVLDINMPGGTGYHALERLRVSTRTQHIPVIVITGSLDPDAEVRAQRFGANGFLKKPVDPNELAELIMKVTAVPQGSSAH